MQNHPVIRGVQKVYETTWFRIYEKIVELPECAEYKRYYSINEGNHVTIVAEDDKKNILLIKQYRPALEDFIIELPGGHVRDNDPEQSAREELVEETGYDTDQLQFLGRVIIDSGRNQGYLYCYYAKDLKRVANCEGGIELIPVKTGELKRMIVAGKFAHSLNMSAVFLASLKGMLIFQ